MRDSPALAVRPARRVAAELRAIYTTPAAEAAFDALAAFSASPWGRKYPQAGRCSRTPATPSHRSWPSARPCASCSTPPTREPELPAAQGYQGRGHFPGDDAVVKLLWLAIINIEDKRARERLARRQQTGKRADQPARLVEGQRVMGWREALNELDSAYPGRLR